MNLVSLEEWNKANITKLLWNLSGKVGRLWIKWVHKYYIKNSLLMNVHVTHNCYKTLRAIMKQRDVARQMQGWDSMSRKFETNRVYQYIKDVHPNVEWMKLFYSNISCPRAIFVFWLACHNRLATKERLHRFSMIENARYNFCTQVETIHHLLFGCPTLKHAWKKMLEWIQVSHKPGEWSDKLNWIARSSKGKG